MNDSLGFPFHAAFLLTIVAVVLQRCTARGGTVEDDIHCGMLAAAKGQLPWKGADPGIDELEGGVGALPTGVRGVGAASRVAGARA